LQAIQIQGISISKHCWNAPSKHKVKKMMVYKTKLLTRVVLIRRQGGD